MEHQGSAPGATPSPALRLIWMALLAFQILLYAVCWMLGAMEPGGAAAHGFDLAALRTGKSGVVALAGVTCFVVAMLLPRKGATGKGAVVPFVVRLALFELTNVTGFVIAFLNGKNHFLMLPFLGLTVAGFLTTRVPE